MHEPDLSRLCSDAEALPAEAEFAALIARSRHGDRDALGTLLLRCEPRLRRIIRIRLGAELRRRVESMDILAQAQTVAFTKLGEDSSLSFERSSDFLHWLVQIALNRINDTFDYHRAQRREAGREIPIDTGSDSSSERLQLVMSEDASPEEQAWRAELRGLLDATVADLPEDQREVVLMRDYEGCEWDEIAAAIGPRSVAASKQLHARAWIEIRKRMRPRLRGMV